MSRSYSKNSKTQATKEERENFNICKNLFIKTSLFYFLELDSFCDVVFNLADRHSYAFHSIAVADGYAAVLNGIEIVYNAEGSTDLILSAVTLADTAGFVVFAHKIGAEVIVYFLRLIAKLLGKRKHRALIGREGGMEAEYVTDIFLTVLGEILFIVCVNKERKQNSVCAERRLDNIRNVLFVGFRVEISKVFAGMGGMSFKVKIGSGSNTP
jgi:hypothetical protein